VLEQLGITPQGVHPEYTVSPEARKTVRRWLASQLADDGVHPLVIVHPGGGVNPGTRMPAKRWPAERYATLIDRLIDAGVTVVLTGSGSDREAVEAVERLARHRVHDLCGRLSIPELAALCAEAQLFVSNDTGPSHLAAAVGTPTVTVFGPTSPLQYCPLGPLSLVCAPVESWHAPTGIDLRRYRRLGRMPGIDQVSLEDVYRACMLVLERAASQGR
jgi:heptosyltransferase-2/heptosyltransferase-3